MNDQLEQLRAVGEANCSAFVKDLQVTLCCSANFGLLFFSFCNLIYFLNVLKI